MKKVQEVLVISDRDGTLIENIEFFGRDADWKTQLRLNYEVVRFLNFIQKKYKTTTVVVTNQSGVARGYFTLKIVDGINQTLEKMLSKSGVKIDNWQYCPDVDATYAKKKQRLQLIKKYIKDKTVRKPSPQMVFQALVKLGKRISEYKRVLVVGDRDEDRKLAVNLQAQFIDIRGKDSRKMISDFYAVINF
ncbi:hypothetical protein A2154_03050 [Candidatus Gottesmanbacteria bacterium RBG_16_43_7]|uniref:D,D-heptose 1,7-bisphosphate phosphatase n=1 Tax=Candidatus Gottesmanbacteria bacterium RBG_16_43_7 TaxID=1798373 RepID=A0A1F5ZBW9_9BACT|nr:MAG: hypothetical protein A2154_03050 [Candidatus Gottesmanbacteria bacterium RBG_16_43_7]